MKRSKSQVPDNKMFGHPRVQDMVQNMLETFEEMTISVRLISSLGMDGPNVNKSIIDKLDQFKRDKGYQQLVNFPPSCLIHVCHKFSPRNSAVWFQI